MKQDQVESEGINQFMTLREWRMLLMLSLLWGASFFFIRIAVMELPPLTVVVLRVGLAALMLLLALRILGLRLPRKPAVWAGFLVMGLFNNVIPFGLIVWGDPNQLGLGGDPECHDPLVDGHRRACHDHRRKIDPP